LKQPALILLSALFITLLGFQVYVVGFALKHNDETRAWLPGICAMSTVVRSICTDTVLLAVTFNILTDKTFPIDTPAARERIKKLHQTPGYNSTN
jgi:hypothetical protein